MHIDLSCYPGILWAHLRRGRHPGQDHASPRHAASRGREAAEPAGHQVERGAAEEALPRLRHDTLPQAAHSVSSATLMRETSRNLELSFVLISAVSIPEKKEL